MKRLREALLDGVHAFRVIWRDYKELQEKAAIERFIKREEKRNAVIQSAFATLTAPDQHFLEHFTDTLDPDHRPDYAHVKRVVEITKDWSIEAQNLLQRELVDRCNPILTTSAFNSWVMRTGYKRTELTGATSYPRSNLNRATYGGIMKLDTVLRRIPVWYKARKSIYLTSPPGMGKTTTMKRSPQLISSATGGRIGFVLINGGLLNEMDSLGYLIPRHHETHTESLYTRPFWWLTTEGKPLEDYDGGVVFIDEEDKMPVECKKIWGEARYSGRLGPHVLPQGWIVWGAGNRSEDRSGSTKELDHLINRRTQVPVQPDLDSLLGWMAENGCMPLTQAFTKTNPEIVLSGKVPDKQGPYCTPRSLCEWDRAAREEYPDHDIPLNDVDVEEMSGGIGESASRQLVNTIRLANEMPSYDEIKHAPDKVKVPERPDALMLIAFSLAAKVNGDETGQIIKYVDRMPKEYSVCFARSAVARDNQLIATPAFNGWCMRNSHLITQIAKRG